MADNDRAEPLAPLAPPQRPPRPWPAYSAPIVAPRPRYGWRRAALWGAVGFVIGAFLTGLIALALLSPPAAPSASGSANGAALKVTLTDGLISNALNAAPTASGIVITQNQAHIQANGQIVISGVLQGATFLAGTPYTIVVQPYVSQHTLAFKTLRFSIAGFPLPPVALSPVESQINQQLAQSSSVSLGAGQTLVVSGVTFSDGMMTVSYVSAPGG